MRSCKVVARRHVAISVEEAKTKRLTKQAYLPQRKMVFIGRKKNREPERL